MISVSSLYAPQRQRRLSASYRAPDILVCRLAVLAAIYRVSICVRNFRPGQYNLVRPALLQALKRRRRQAYAQSLHVRQFAIHRLAVYHRVDTYFEVIRLTAFKAVQRYFSNIAAFDPSEFAIRAHRGQAIPNRIAVHSIYRLPHQVYTAQSLLLCAYQHRCRRDCQLLNCDASDIGVLRRERLHAINHLIRANLVMISVSSLYAPQRQRRLSASYRAPDILVCRLAVLAAIYRVSICVRNFRPGQYNLVRPALLQALKRRRRQAYAQSLHVRQHSIVNLTIGLSVNTYLEIVRLTTFKTIDGKRCRIAAFNSRQLTKGRNSGKAPPDGIAADAFYGLPYKACAAQAFLFYGNHRGNLTIYGFGRILNLDPSGLCSQFEVRRTLVMLRRHRRLLLFEAHTRYI